MRHETRLQKPLPAKAATGNLALWLVVVDTIFNVLGFFTGAATTFFNFVINLGLFFLGAVA